MGHQSLLCKKSQITILQRQTVIPLKDEIIFWTLTYQEHICFGIKCPSLNPIPHSPKTHPQKLFLLNIKVATVMKSDLILLKDPYWCQHASYVANTSLQAVIYIIALPLTHFSEPVENGNPRWRPGAARCMQGLQGYSIVAIL